MALINTYQNNITRLKNAIAKLTEDKARESKKAVDVNLKISRAKKTLTTTKSASIAKSKASEIARHQNAYSIHEKNISNLEKKIAEKEKKLAMEEKKYLNEKNKLDKKALDLEKKRQKAAEKQMDSVLSSIDQHEHEQRRMNEVLQELQSLPEVITVLFLASNPQDVSQLQLGEEAREIQNMIRLSEYRESVKFETRWAVRPADILQAINETNPTIVHFSGHGCASGELVLQNPDGSPKLVTPEAISQTMSVASDNIRLLFFNACFSSIQAEGVVENVEASIGMNDSIGDVAARVFAAQFYSAIGFGHSLNVAFEQAKAALMLEGIPEEKTPVLVLREDIDSNDVYLVRPAADVLEN